MASSGKKRDWEAESVVVGACSGWVKLGQPILGNTVTERGKVEVDLRASVSCSRLEEGGRGRERERERSVKKTGKVDPNYQWAGPGHQITKISTQQWT